GGSQLSCRLKNLGGQKRASRDQDLAKTTRNSMTPLSSVETPAVLGLGMLQSANVIGIVPDTSMLAPFRRAVTGKDTDLVTPRSMRSPVALAVISVLSGGSEPKSIGCVRLNVAVRNCDVLMMRPLNWLSRRPSSLLMVATSTLK